MDYQIPQALAVIAQGRDLITTKEFAKATNKATQTIRKNYCMQGHCFGIVPIKIGANLAWPVKDVAKLLLGL